MASKRRTVTKWLVLAALVPAWWLSAPVRGYLTAEVDLLRGKYTVLGYGLPPSWQPEYARLLHERYGVQYRPVAGCMVSQDLVWYVGAYNRVSMSAARHRFGHDIFKETIDEAAKTSAR
jgi:hypothetical protein